MLLAELDESAFCSARSRVCRSLLSLETELGGGGAGGGAALDEPLAELADDDEVALELEVDAAAWLAAASRSCIICQLEALLDEPTDPTDIADTFLGPVQSPARGRGGLVACRRARLG